MSGRPPDLELLLDRAGDLLGRGNAAGAVELLKQILGRDPEYAAAHGLLALALLQTRRVHAAEHEAGLALTFGPDEPLAHYAMASVAMARRRFSRAEEHLDHLVSMDPNEPRYLRARGSLYRLTGRRREAEEALNRALALDPNDPATIVDVGELMLERGELDGAELKARDALKQQPEHLDGLVLMGNILLRRSKVQEAREHAVWALRIDATDEGALHLMAAVKARESRLLGLWWRYNTRMSELGERGVILVLVGAFVVYRATTILLQGSDQASLANIVELGWLGIVLYTWVGPSMFHRMLNRELEQVKLDAKF